MIGQGDYSPTLVSILTRALEKLYVLDGLTVNECAARCVLTGHIPTLGAYSQDVVTAYQRLEQDLTRGNPSTREEVMR
jgi:hypothetical protein